METNPIHYGLSIHTQLVELDDNRLGIRRVIKSRIIRKDALKIVEIANQIRNDLPDLKLTLICTRNICSKSVALLESKGVEILFVDLAL